MNLKEYSQPEQLERYSFLWSEVRLIIAAISLFLGGVPVAYLLFCTPSLCRAISLLVSLSWIVSGVAAGYLLYRWFAGKRILFGGKKLLDTAAFLVSVVSGINLGLAGILRKNIGMELISSPLKYYNAGPPFIFVVVGLIYLASAFYLFWRWTVSGRRIF